MESALKQSDPSPSPSGSAGAAAAPPAGEWAWLEPALRRMSELGLTGVVFDGQGQAVLTGPMAGPFSRMLRATAPPCMTAQHVSRLLGDPGQSNAIQCLPGCNCLLLPIQRRRRRQGTLAACYVGRDLRDTEELARLCQARSLDRQAVINAARQEARFDSDQLPAVRSTVKLMLDQAAECHVAQTELAELSQDLTNTYEGLSLVYKIAAGMTVTEKASDYLRGVGAELLEVVGIESLAIRYFRSDQPLVSEHISIGAELTSPTVEQTMWDELLRRFEQEPEDIVNNQASSQSGGPLKSLVGQHRVRQLAAVPIVRNGKLIGAIVAMNKTAGEFNSVDVKLVRSIADEAAVFLENAFLYEDLQQLLMGMLRALTSSIDAKDPYTCGHSERVALIASKIAQAAGLDGSTVSRVYLAGLLHDIGKIGVPEAVLTKPGRLTKAEFAVMRKHPEIGAKILAGIKQVQDLVPGVLCHHERVDGRGYPRGLSGGNIPIFGRIIGLADCFDAMTSNRTYRRSLPLEVTLTEIRRFAGTQFDPQIVEAFFKLDPAELLRQARSAEPLNSLNGAQSDFLAVGGT